MEHAAQFAMGSLLITLALGSLLAWLVIFQRLANGRALTRFEPHAVVPWNGLDVIVLVLAALFLQQFALDGAVQDGVAPEVISAPKVAGTGAAWSVWVALAVTYLIARVGTHDDDLGVPRGTLGGDLRLAAGTFLAAMLPVYGVQVFLTQVAGFESKHPLQELASKQPTVGVLLLATVVAVLVAPLAEELLFRVILQGWLEKKQIESRKRRGIEPAEPAGFAPIVAVSLVFGMMHYGHGPDPVALFVLSLFLGYAYQRTHRLFAPLAIHMGVNSLAMLQQWVSFVSGTQ